MHPKNTSLALHDKRNFFEKSLAFGIRNGIIDAQKMAQISTEGAKGIVQIARYFGTEFLQPELEKAKDRMVNLISLYLEQSTNADLTQAAISLRDHSLLSRSKGGADMLKNLLAMPDHSHFGMVESDVFTDDQIPLLGKWCHKNLADYRTELTHRQHIQNTVEAAYWFAQSYGISRRNLKAEHTDAEAVLRTCLLMQACGDTQIPTWRQFEAHILRLRTLAAQGKSISFKLPAKLPAAFKPPIQALCQTLQKDDLAKILDPRIPVTKLFFQNLSFLGRYFWLGDGIEEIVEFDRTMSATWKKLTKNRSDDGSLLTLFLTTGAGSPPKIELTPTGAARLIRKIRKSGLQTELVSAFIRDCAPEESQADYLHLWQEFWTEAQRSLQDQRDTQLTAAMSILQLNCNIQD